MDGAFPRSRAQAGHVAILEYFVIATVVFLAVIALFDNGRFRAARTSVESAVDQMIRTVCEGCTF